METWKEKEKILRRRVCTAVYYGLHMLCGGTCSGEAEQERWFSYSWVKH